MRAFKNKWFNKWARDEDIRDDTLWKAAEEIVAGRVEADLGKCLYKKRGARKGQGKSGGYRLIVAYKRPNLDRLFFISAFGKTKSRA
ncbi:type II toxin-antitoxin system RelE/ParE family toxin [Fundidesulfovibrio putealis]|uniref:type II toxin-antitoxin system RelE/ParE family toxin n=1 Tax=Fundidesulfovibrio putealis TaxID=270496 RepID=UPI000684FFE9|nr:type II toxin-antitoxin system RelE/ParE family toxin [Fundidesulfovibrio putealis]